MAYAGFWLRVVAAIIDGVLISIVMWVVSLALNAGMMMDAAQMGGQMTEEQALAIAAAAMRNSVILFVVSLVIGIVYYCGMESSARQATLGKMAVGVKVTDEAGNRISFGRAVGRYFAKFASTIILLIGFLMVAFTEKKQGLHDKLAGTLVVKKA
jgi:uncharacterized RDD family membrane protein YckC